MSQNVRIIFLAAMALVYFTSFNGYLPVTDPVESNYALTAKEMVESGDYLSPQIYGKYWFDKPIMIYWLIAACYKLINIGEFAVRLPGGIFSTASLLLAYWFSCRIYHDRHGAMLAAVVLATSLQFWVLGKMIITDSVLFFFTSASMATFYLGLAGEGRKWYMAAYALAGLAVLTKGPVGIVLPGITIFVYIAVKRQWHLLKKMYILQGTAVFLLVTAPWYLAMYNLHGQAFVDSFLGLHNYIRATVSEHPQDNVIYYYLVVFPVSLLPWTGALVLFIKDIKRQMRSSANDYLFVWPLVMIIFYTCMATKYLTYVFPALFPVSILLGNYLASLRNRGGKLIWLWVSLPAALFFLLIAVAAKYFVNGYLPPIYAAVALALAALCWAQFKGSGGRVPETAALGVVIVSMVLVNCGLINIADSRSAKSIASLISPGEAALASYGGYATSMVFYSGHTMPRLADKESEKDVWDLKYTMPTETPAEFFRRAQDKPAYILARSKNKEQLMKEPIFSSFKLVGENRDMFLFYRDCSSTPVR